MTSDKTITASAAMFDPNDPDTLNLLHSAREAQLADQQLTIRQALRKYKKGVFWAMLLSTALIMEGYDVVIVSHGAQCVLMPDLVVLRSETVPRTVR